MTTQQLDRQIQELRAIEAEQAAELAAAQQDLQNWQRALQVDLSNNATAGTIANSQMNIQRAAQRVKDAEAALKVTQRELREAVARRQDIENAALEAIRNGVSPDKAYADAEAQQRSREALMTTLKWVAIALLLIGLVYLGVKKFRKK